MQMPNVGSWLESFSKEKRRQLAVDQSRAASMRGSEELGRIVDFVRDHYGTRYAAISIIDRRSQVLLAQRGFEADETPRDTAFCAVTIQQGGRALVIPDAREDPRFATFASVTSDPFVRFYAGVAITDEAGLALGAICVADSNPLAESFDRSLLVLAAREAEREIAASARHLEDDRPLRRKAHYFDTGVQSGQVRTDPE
jgi:GAF domain-containing protein